MLHVHRLQGRMLEGVNLPKLNYDRAEAQVATLEGWSWYISAHSAFLGTDTVTERVNGRVLAGNTSTGCDRLKLGELPDGNPAFCMADGGDKVPAGQTQPDIGIASAYGTFKMPNSEAFTFFAVHYPKPYVDGTGVITDDTGTHTLRDYVNSSGSEGVHDVLFSMWNMQAEVQTGQFAPSLLIRGKEGWVQVMVRQKKADESGMENRTILSVQRDVFATLCGTEAERNAVYIMLTYSEGTFRVYLNGTLCGTAAQATNRTIVATAAEMGFPGYGAASFSYRATPRWKGMIGCAGLLGRDLSASEGDKAVLDAFILNKYRLTAVTA